MSHHPATDSAASDRTPSVREIVDLLARLRRLSDAGRTADPAERERFLADKAALVARIPRTDGDRS